MDASHCPPYPHYSWLAHWLAVRPPRVFDIHECRHVTHQLLLTTDGDAEVLWTTNGSETGFHAAAGDIGFFPCDRDRHTLSITAAAGYVAYVLCVPDEHVGRACAAEGMRPPQAFRAVPAFRDVLMRASLLRLSTRTGGSQVAEDIGDEIAARQIVLRLCALVGSPPPDWHKDASVFTPGIMRLIVERIDAHLGVHESLVEMAGHFGLSPGHFARKFQQSAGLSLNRFMNRRRLGTSLEMLREGAHPLSLIALDLGFSSQSHFTRMFSGLTGITPRQYRRLHAKMCP